MKRAIQLMIVIIISLLVSSVAFSHETSEEKIELKEKEVNNSIKKRFDTFDYETVGVWEMQSSERGRIGLLAKEKNIRRIPETVIFIFDKNDECVGKIDASGFLKPKGWMLKTTKISKEGASLYLDALKVIDQIR